MKIIERSDNMRLRKVKNANERLEKSPYFLKNPEEYKGKFKEVFQNENSIHLEIGMGKGAFLIEMAKTFKEVNFIGVEKYDSVLVRAIEKADELKLSNIKFICYDAANIDEVFNHEIDLLYLNFSDPWPKNRNAKRRLTHENFLKKYDTIFKQSPHIKLKTDNIGLFAFSLESLSKYGYTLEKVSLDLAGEDLFNIETEYEQKFKSLGYKINYVEAIKKER